MMTRTYLPKAPATSERQWFLVDATGKTLGHLAEKIAVTLRGKNKPVYTPHIDMGDYVVVVNADKVVLSGNKEEQKEHIHHTHYWGHLRRAPIKRVRATHPTRIIEQAVDGMLARNRMRQFIIRRLKVYAGAEHPHKEKTLKPLSI
jgi:large subunit ribosomal protein L13